MQVRSFFNGAFVVLLPAIYLGATVVILSSFNVHKYIEAVYREKVTHGVLVPSQIVSLLKLAEFGVPKMESMECVISLGAPLLNQTKEELAQKLPGRFYELYGTTEGLVTILTNDDYPKKPKSVGKPPPYTSITILNEKGERLPPNQVGEICGTSLVAMTGYYKDPVKTSEAIINGIMHTGDLGYLDDDGYLYLVDRKKDMIISGGVKVYPKDIEEIIAKHPSIQEVAVFGAENAKWGEVPVAAVILNPSAPPISVEKLKSWINERVDAKYQRVHYISIMQNFPRNVAGKTLKRELRDQWSKHNSVNQKVHSKL